MKKTIRHLAFVIVGLCIAGMAANAITNESFPPPRGKLVSGIPMVRQSTTYSCGAAAIQSVLAFYGKEYNESEVMKEVKTNQDGTEIEEMAKLAQKEGISATIKTGLSLNDIAERIFKNQPVIVEVQAWSDDEDPNKDYENVWDSGHYLVVVAMDADRIYFMDPSLLGSHGFMPIDTFLTRWHEISTKHEKLHHTAILFDGKSNVPPKWAYIQ